MLNKKATLFLITMIVSLILFSCNDKEIENDTSIIKESENTSDEKQNDYSETTMNSNGNDDAYLKSQLNELANNLFREADYYFTEYETNEELIYSNVRNDDGFGREIVRQSPRVEEIEYIFIFNSSKQIETAMVWNCSNEKKYVGCSGKIESIEEINAKNWDEVLTYYGLKEKEYTSINSDKVNESSTSPTLDKEDPDVANSCILAYSLAREYATDYSDKPAVYGIRSKDEKFIKNTQWDIPSHGDIEYIIIFDTSGNLYRVLCWDTDKDKKYVGDSELGENGDNIAELNWDDVLEKYGFKQGQYTT